MVELTLCAHLITASASLPSSKFTIVWWTGSLVKSALPSTQTPGKPSISAYGNHFRYTVHVLLFTRGQGYDWSAKLNCENCAATGKTVPKISKHKKNTRQTRGGSLLGIHSTDTGQALVCVCAHVHYHMMYLHVEQVHAFMPVTEVYIRNGYIFWWPSHLQYQQPQPCPDCGQVVPALHLLCQR